MFKKWKLKRQMKKVQQLEEEVLRMKGGKPRMDSDSTKELAKEDLKRLDLGVRGKYITKDLKLTWVFLILAAVLVIVGITIFSQWKFKDINQQFAEKVAELEKTYVELQERESTLNKTSQELQIKSERESSLSDQYSDVKAQRDKLQQEKDTLEDDKAALETRLQAAEEEIEDLEDENDKLKAEIEQLEDESN